MHDDSALPFSFQFLGAVGLDLPELNWKELLEEKTGATLRFYKQRKQVPKH